MDIECEGPGCDEIAQEAREAMAVSAPEAAERYREIRRRMRYLMPSFVEFFIISFLDLFHPYSKESVFWEVYVQDKGAEKRVAEVGGGGG